MPTVFLIRQTIRRRTVVEKANRLYYIFNSLIDIVLYKVYYYSTFAFFLIEFEDVVVVAFLTAVFLEPTPIRLAGAGGL